MILLLLFPHYQYYKNMRSSIMKLNEVGVHNSKASFPVSTPHPVTRSYQHKCTAYSNRIMNSYLFQAGLFFRQHCTAFTLRVFASVRREFLNYSAKQVQRPYKWYLLLKDITFLRQKIEGSLFVSFAYVLEYRMFEKIIIII